MKLTVAICTWNRAALLDQTLEQFKLLDIPAGIEWELIVVNNASTDDTDSVISRHASELPIRSIVESKQGHCHARNCAIDHASGQWMLWTDDDVLVDPDWVVNYLEAIKRFPDAVFAGGTVTPWFATSPPLWVLANLNMLQGPFAIRELGIDVRWLDGEETVFGANMAFRTDVLRKHRFDPTFGLVGDGAIRGDEADVIKRVRAEGGRGVWAGTAKVAHYIPAERLTTAYIRKFSSGYGQTISRQQTTKTVATLFGRPKWALKKYLQHRALELALAPFQSRRWLQSLQQAAIHHGIMDHHRSQRADHAQ